MKSMVRFRAADAVFVVPAERVLAVRAAAEVRALPGQRRGVAGLLERDGRVLTVVAPLVSQGAHVLVLESAEGVIGLLVDEVLGIGDIQESELKPPPPGQERPLIEGVLTDRGGLAFVLSVGSLWKGLDGETAPSARKPVGRLADEIPLRVLLVEDNVVVQKVMKRMLGKLGYEADLATNGRESVDAIERGGYDVVFMDVQMPEMNGLEAARTITKSDASSRPVIIAMTAAEGESDRQACMDAGMDACLVKPVTEADLRAALDRWGRRTRPGDLAANRNDDPLGRRSAGVMSGS
jgi:CheY-like chemotaxis protein/chemotaxis signal transduction protein